MSETTKGAIPCLACGHPYGAGFAGMLRCPLCGAKPGSRRVPQYRGDDAPPAVEGEREPGDRERIADVIATLYGPPPRKSTLAAADRILTLLRSAPAPAPAGEDNVRHPWYGPCDAFDNGECAECSDTIARLRAELEAAHGSLSNAGAPDLGMDVPVRIAWLRSELEAAQERERALRAAFGAIAEWADDGVVRYFDGDQAYKRLKRIRELARLRALAPYAGPPA